MRACRRRVASTSEPETKVGVGMDQFFLAAVALQCPRAARYGHRDEARATCCRPFPLWSVAIDRAHQALRRAGPHPSHLEKQLKLSYQRERSQTRSAKPRDDDMKAIWHGQVIAESEQTREVGGYTYFPRHAVRMDLLSATPRSQSDLACPHG